MKWDTTPWNSGISVFSMPQENVGKGNKICPITPKEHFAQRMGRELAGVGVVAPVEPVKVAQVKWTAHVPTPSLPVCSLQLEGCRRGSGRTSSGDHICEPPVLLLKLLKSWKKKEEKVRKRSQQEAWPKIQMNAFCDRWRGSAGGSCPHPTPLDHGQYRQPVPQELTLKLRDLTYSCTLKPIQWISASTLGKEWNN